jgi:hypothetical protein
MRRAIIEYYPIKKKFFNSHRNPTTEPVRAPSRRRNHRAFLCSTPSFAIRDQPKGSKGTRLRSLGRRPRAKPVARFWLLLSRDKSNYPFRGIPAVGLIPVNLERKTFVFRPYPEPLTTKTR